MDNIKFTDCIRKIEIPSKLKKNKYQSNGKYPVVSQEKDLINGYCNFEEMLIKVESPLIIFGDHTRILKYIDFDFILGADGAKVIQPKENLHPKYFYYFLILNTPKSRGYSRHFRYLKELTIPVPELKDQINIVKQLDIAFEKIQNIKNQLSKKNKLFIELKKSIISKHTKKDNDKKTNLIWERNSLGDLCKTYKDDIVDGPFGSNLKTKDYTDEGVPVLKIQHVKQFEINYSKPTFISNQKYKELIRHSFKKGDIVLTKLGKPLGAASIVKEIDEGIIVADLIRVRIDPKKIDNEFLCYQLNSSHIQADINSYTKGATRPRIKLDVIRNLKINYPSLKEQIIISKKLNTLVKEVSESIKINEEIDKQLELLRFSLLRNLLEK